MPIRIIPKPSPNHHTTSAQTKEASSAGRAVRRNSRPSPIPTCTSANNVFHNVRLCPAKCAAERIGRPIHDGCPSALGSITSLRKPFEYINDWNCKAPSSSQIKPSVIRRPLRVIENRIFFFLPFHVSIAQARSRESTDLGRGVVSRSSALQPGRAARDRRARRRSDGRRGERNARWDVRAAVPAQRQIRSYERAGHIGGAARRSGARLGAGRAAPPRAAGPAADTGRLRPGCGTRPRRRIIPVTAFIQETPTARSRAERW